MTKREREILDIINSNPMISQNEIAEKLDITRSSVGVHITNLINKGRIRGRGYIVSKDQYITVIGGANVDIVGKSADQLIKKDSNPGTIRSSCGGVGRNIAENLARLNIDTRLITSIGNDSKGMLIKDNASLHKIDLSNSLILDNYHTATYLAILDNKNDMDIAISDMDIIETISPEFLIGKKSLIDNSKLIVLDTNLRHDSLECILQNTSKDIFLDTVSIKKAEKIKDLLPYIHTLKPNKYEASFLSGIDINSEARALEAGRILIDKGLERAFITLGEEGTYYFDRNRELKVSYSKIDAENTTGGGDAFMAGLAYSYYNELSIEETIYTAVGASRVAIKDINTISSNLSIENIRKEKKEIRIC